MLRMAGRACVPRRAVGHPEQPAQQGSAMTRLHRIGAWGAIVQLALAATGAQAQACKAESGVQAPVVVELYTSEGCNSCPPADRWLSTLKDRPGVLAAAFHVDYWDRLGWKDRFASARYTERQAQLQAAAGARYSYTPQVIVNGADWRRWPELPAASAAAPVRLALQRDGAQVDVQVQPLRDAGKRWSLWWAALEDGHVSNVRAGENSGVQLRHDHVVRAYGRIEPWSGPLAQRITVPSRGEGGRALRLLTVVTDAQTGATVQALQLHCAG
jgi:hypothetical protein